MSSTSPSPPPGLDLKSLVANVLLGAAANGGHIDPQSLLGLAAARTALNQGNVSPAPARGLQRAANASNGHASLQYLGDTTGVRQSLLNTVADAARDQGATKIRVTSGRRSPGHNRAVGGVQRSNHLTGDALDGEAYVPGRGWVPLGTLLKPNAGRYGLRSGDQPGFYNGRPDPVHVDDGANQRR